MFNSKYVYDPLENTRLFRSRIFITVKILSPLAKKNSFITFFFHFFTFIYATMLLYYRG